MIPQDKLVQKLQDLRASIDLAQAAIADANEWEDMSTYGAEYALKQAQRQLDNLLTKLGA